MPALANLVIITSLLGLPFFGYSQKALRVWATDSLEAVAKASFLLDSLHNEGHLAARMASRQQQTADTAFVIQLHAGPVFTWLSLRADSLPEEMQTMVGTHTRQPLRLATWQQLKEKLLRYAENHGYPFARIRLDIESIEQEQLSAAIAFQAGPRITFDSIQIVGNSRINPSFIQTYLGLQPGRLFSQSVLENATRRLRELPFLKINRQPGLRFREQRAQLVLDLSDRSASRFNFIVGVLPNSQQTSRLLVTADLEAELRNALGKGERIYGHFQQLRPASQELELALDYPYLFQLPFGTQLDFRLYKRDSNFLEINWEVGLQYLMKNGNRLQFFWQQQQSRLLEIDLEQVTSQLALPAQLDLRQSLFGFSYSWQNLDYRNNPRRGSQVQLKAALGNKRIGRNTSIEALGLAYLYDSLQTQALQGKVELSLAHYFPLFQQSTLRLAGSGGLLFSQAAVYANEQFRLGGNQLLRGFDEEFFFARYFAVSTLEYRLLIDTNSFLFAFWDSAYLQDNQSIQYPFGFGAGISLETSSGIFSLSMAYGKSPQTPLDLSSPKVHFGYLSLF